MPLGRTSRYGIDPSGTSTERRHATPRLPAYGRNGSLEQVALGRTGAWRQVPRRGDKSPALQP